MQQITKNDVKKVILDQAKFMKRIEMPMTEADFDQYRDRIEQYNVVNFDKLWDEVQKINGDEE